VSDANANAIAQDEARIDSRFPASAVPGITSVRLSPGDAVELVNISKSGVLVEGRTRFVPGTRVTVIFDGGFTPASIKGKVVRCQVSSISGGALRYQSGIQFEKRLDVLEPHSASAPAAAASPATAARAATPAPALAAPAAPRRVVNRW
jgi:hypothetical protein